MSMDYAYKSGAVVWHATSKQLGTVTDLASDLGPFNPGPWYGVKWAEDGDITWCKAESIEDAASLLAGSLTDDGDTVDLPDGRTLRLTVESDDMSIMDEQGDGMWCGRLEWGRIWSQGGTRPDNFDGNAEVIHVDYPNRLWWQPPADVKRNDPSFTALRSAVLDILTCGYNCLVVELLDGEPDVYNRRPVVSVASLGGVEVVADGAYVATVVADLLREVLS